jgi:hypothetical protein
MRFLVNSNAVKKMALTTHERPMETPRPDLSVSNDEEMARCRGHTAIHPRVEELNLGPVLLILASNKAIALVDTLCGVDWEDLEAGSASCHLGNEWTRTHAQLTSPHMPPAVTTAKGVVGEPPRAFARSCFILSYVTK